MRCLSLILALTVSAPALAQQAEDLESLTRAEAEARAEKARLDARRASVTKEIDTLKARLAAATNETRAFEREGARLADELNAITARLGDLEVRQTENRDKTVELLAALQRLQMSPPVASIAEPDDAVKTAQAAKLIEGLSAELRKRAASLARLSEELIATRDDAQARQLELDANNRELIRRRDRTRTLVAEKEALRASIAAEADIAAAEVARLVAESASLRELLDRLAEPVPDAGPSIKPARPSVEAPVERPAGTARFADAKGSVLVPVSGSLARRFGRGEQGQTYSAPREGQVVAPYSGRVEFAGPFKGHGQVVILNFDDGYFLLMTGLEQTFVATRETVGRGEPIGAMPSAGDAQLYLELRHNGRTIDPAPWLG